jgi:hypothetical protein
MLVLVSDLHITDETTANNVNPEAFELLGAEIVDAVARRGAREIHLVLLGDILDLVRSDYWHRHAIPMAGRPWGGTIDPLTGMNADRPAIEIQFQAVLGAILASSTARWSPGTATNGTSTPMAGASGVRCFGPPSRSTASPPPPTRPWRSARP